MKKSLFAFFCLLIVLSLSACAAKSNENLERPGKRMLDFGQPEKPANLSGLVKSILGNELTILKIEKPVFNQGEKTDSEDKVEEKKTALSIGASNGGGMPRGNFGGGRQAMNNGDNTAMLEVIKNMSSGEEKIIIPVGIQMLKKDNSDTKTLNMVEATLADIKTDSMLMIWLDESVTDRKVASFVVIN